MSRESIICGLDVGTSNIRAVVAQLVSGQEKPQIIGIGSVSSFGLRKGVVVDIEETAKGIREAIGEAERASDVSIRYVFVNIGGHHISCRASKGVVAVSRADGEISREDTDRAIKAAKAISIPQNRELIHTICRSFTVDEEKNIKDPVGMSGVRLESDVLMIEGATPYMKNLTKSLNEAEVEVADIAFSPLVASKAVLTKRQKELGVLVLDLGGGTSGLTVFEEGDIIHTCALPVGGGHITNDIAIGLRTSVEVAERVKLEYGFALPEEINKKEVIDLTKLEGEEGVVSRRYIAEIINARLVEIFDLANRELKKIGRQGLLPAGLVLVGGGAKMPGIVDLAKEELKLPAQIGFPAGVDGIVNQIDDPSFAAAVGLALWGVNEQEKIPDRSFAFSELGGIFGKLQKWLKAFMP